MSEHATPRRPRTNDRWEQLATSDHELRARGAGCSLDSSQMVVATLPWEAIEAQSRVYLGPADGQVTPRRRVFGLEGYHYETLRWCQKPRTVADLAALLQREKERGSTPPAETHGPNSEAAPHAAELAFSVSGSVSPPALPMSEIRMLLGKLLDEGLVRIVDPHPARASSPYDCKPVTHHLTWTDSDEPRLDLVHIVVATVTSEDVQAESKTYHTSIGGEVTTRQRNFGLGEDHLKFIHWCQKPRTVADLAVRLARERPPIARSEAEPPLSAPELDGIPEMPLAEVRAILRDLAAKCLVRILQPPSLKDRRLYLELLLGIRCIGANSHH